jgi:hypothetical protein
MSATTVAVQAELKKLDTPDPKVVVEEEEVEEVEIVEEGEEGDTEEGHESSPDEETAQQSGWRPKDEWDGNPDEWVSAREFNRRGELMRKIHNQNRQIKQLDGVVNTLASQQKKIFGAGYEKAKRELKSQLREANKEGDDATAEVIEERLEQLETVARQDAAALQSTTPPAQSQVAPEFEPWVNRNTWFKDRPEMRAYAEVIGMQYAQTNPEATNSQVYEFITKQVKTKFPERFGTVKKQSSGRPGSPVESGDNLTSNRGGPAVSRVSLTSEEKEVGRTLVKRGLYKNMNEYASDLKKFGVK